MTYKPKSNKFSYFKRLKMKAVPCKICNNTLLNFDNFFGWSNMAIRCRECQQTVYGSTPEETVDNWNKANK